jgi:mevalonate kinase
MDPKEKKIYPSKILLIGEYSVLDGFPAMAVPNQKIGAWWDYSNDSSEYKEKLEAYGQYLNDLFKKWPDLLFDHQGFHREIGKGLMLRSSIPEGYGAGSSGALVAAVFDRFVTSHREITIESLQKVLAAMESHFHGVSSGLDPLVSYLNKACLVRQSAPEIVNHMALPAHLRIYLLDSKMKRNTWKLVNLYKATCKENEEFAKATGKLGILNEEAIKMLRNKDEKVITVLKNISAIQLQFFAEFIPEAVRSHWKEGLSSGDFTMKLCGAGGGGYFLVFATQIFEAKRYFQDCDLIELILSENNSC